MSEPSFLARLAEIFFVFLRIGATGFGGPLSLVAIMNVDIVNERKWMSQDEFQRAFALIKAMPGTLAFSLATYIGRRRAGFWGGAAAAIALVLPAFLLVLLFSTIYDSVSGNAQFAGLLTGMQVAAIGLILLALKPLCLPYLKISIFWATFAAAVALSYATSLPEPILIVLGGLTTLAFKRLKPSAAAHMFALAPLATETQPATLQKLFEVCFKAGAFVFGSGIAIAPLMERDFVHELGWLSLPEFLNALAVGQITPGPVLITATFIGFKKLGMTGALTATAGVFLPSFFHMVTWFPWAIQRVSRMKWLEDFLIGAIAAVAATIVLTCLRLLALWHDEKINYVLLAILVGLLVKFRWSSWVIIVLGGLAGVALSFTT